MLWGANKYSDFWIEKPATSSTYPSSVCTLSLPLSFCMFYISCRSSLFPVEHDPLLWNVFCFKHRYLSLHYKIKAIRFPPDFFMKPWAFYRVCSKETNPLQHADRGWCHSVLLVCPCWASLFLYPYAFWKLDKPSLLTSISDFVTTSMM